MYFYFAFIFFVPAVVFLYIVVIVFFCICCWIRWSEKEQGCLATPQFHSPPLVNSQRSELRPQIIFGWKRDRRKFSDIETFLFTRLLWGTFILNISIRYSMRGYRIDKIISQSLIYLIDIQIYIIESDNKSLIVYESARTNQEEKSAKNALNQFSICLQIIDSPLQLLRIRALMWLRPPWISSPWNLS